MNKSSREVFNLKLVLIGDRDVGKTSFLQRLIGIKINIRKEMIFSLGGEFVIMKSNYKKKIFQISDMGPVRKAQF